MRRSTVLRSLLVVLPLFAAITGCSDDDGATPDSAQASTSELATVAHLKPVADIANTQVWGGGGRPPIYALVDDGTSFAAANDSDFARSAPGVANAAVTLGYGGAPAGGASKVVVQHRARALSGAVGTVQVKLYDGATLLGAGPVHSLTAAYQNFSDAFDNLFVADANQLRTELAFHNASGGTTSLGDSMVWIDVTPRPVSNELLHAGYPDAFVSNATGQPVILNGFNLRTTGHGGWAQPLSDFVAIHDKGFNMMRLAVQWNDVEPTQGQFDQTVLGAIDTTIARCKAAGVYVVLDPIHANTSPKFPTWAVQTGDDDFDTVLRSARPYMEMMARRYANEPQVVAVDLLNEPQGSPGIDSAWTFNGYNTLMSWVRPLMPNKIMIVAGIGGDIDLRKLDLTLLRDRSNVVFTQHFYFAGGEADGYSDAGWATAGQYTWKHEDYLSQNPAQLEAHLQASLTALGTVKLPLWIGEYGIFPDVAHHDQWLTDMTAMFKTHHMSRTLWEYHWGAMAAVDSNKQFYPWVDILTH